MGRNHRARVFVREGIRDSADRRSDHRAPASQGFKNHVGHAFGPTRKDEEGGFVEQFRNGVVGLRSQDLHTIGAECTFMERPHADEPKGGGRHFFSHDGPRIEEIAEAFLRFEAAHKQHTDRPMFLACTVVTRGLFPRKKQGLIDAVRNERDEVFRNSETNKLAAEALRHNDDGVGLGQITGDGARGRGVLSDDVDVGSVNLHDAGFVKPLCHPYRRAAVGKCPASENRVGVLQ